MKRIAIAIFTVVLFGGCSYKTTICPKYPKPSQTVLNKIQKLNDTDVDKWMMEQFKLNKKLKVCNE